MQTKHAAPKYSESLLWGDIFTGTYILLLISFLYTSNIYIKIGRFDNVWVVLLVAATEVMKYVIYAISCKSLSNKNIAKSCIKTLFMLVSTLIGIYVIAVLFGAPAFSNFQETGMFSLIVTSVTALPICLYLGAESTVDMFLSLTSYEGDNVQNIFMLKLRLSLFGAWLGAVVIPLDWNRPWQEWPIPCCMGTFLGYVLANCASSGLFFRHRKKLSEKTGKYTL